jgi:formate hydrogenlyase subunit 3/multisubunit Na+/H+ antiporter MnhD subunit
MMSNAIIWVIVTPLLGSLLSIIWSRYASFIATISNLLALAASIIIVSQVYQSGPFNHELGSWQSGLGINLRADALSSILLLMSMMVISAATFYASAYFTDAVKRARFWPLWLMLVVALNALLLSGDLFNLYVTLELLGLSAVALTALSDNRAALQAAIRYLSIGLLGSLVFLAGVALIYMGYGTLDLVALSNKVEADPLSQVAFGMMTAGLLIKSALFPLHFWLPSAHASAPAPVSAALSALVVKVAVYILLRLWVDVFDLALTPLSAMLLGTLGAIAVIWGSWQALQAQRLKLMAAYSTVAQIGYLFIFLPLIVALPEGPLQDAAFTALLLMALTHGFAKSAFFLSAGVIQQYCGHDRIAELGGTARALPLTISVIALSGVALIGLPPSGSFLGKWYLISSSFQAGQWWWVPVIAIGSILATAYVFRILGYAFGPGESVGRVLNWGREEIPALVLSLFATLILGFGSAELWDFVSQRSDFLGN